VRVLICGTKVMIELEFMGTVEQERSEKDPNLEGELQCTWNENEWVFKMPNLGFHSLQKTPFMSILTICTIKKNSQAIQLLSIPHASNLSVAHFLL